MTASLRFGRIAGIPVGASWSALLIALLIAWSLGGRLLPAQVPGLTPAAYLARAGRSVLVLERRERLGGACTLEQPFADPGYLVSPCAYVVGLLDQTAVD